MKRFRYILTHADGKLELVGLLPGREDELVCRWHQVRRGVTREGLHLARITPETTWLQQ